MPRLAFAIRLLVDLVAVTALVRGVYHHRHRRGDLFPTFLAVNPVVFLITRALDGAEMTLGAAFGLVMAVATGGWPVSVGIGAWRNTVGTKWEYAKGTTGDPSYAHRPDAARSYDRTFDVLGNGLALDAKLGGRQ